MKEFRLIQRKNRNFGVIFKADPERIEYSTGTKDREEAEKIAQDVLMGKRILKRTPHNLPMTLEVYARDFFLARNKHSFYWKNMLLEKNYADSFYKGHQSRLECYILPRFGKTKINKIDPDEVFEWYATLKSVNTGKKLSSTYKNKIRNTFFIVMEFAKMNKVISKNPIEEVPSITEHYNRRMAFEERELKKMFPCEIRKRIIIWGDLQWATYFSIAYDTGWRPSEISGLEKTKFLPEYRGIYTKNGVVNGILQKRIKTTGTGKDYKVGVLSETTAHLVSLLIEEKQNEIFLFKTLQGNFIQPNTANKHLKAVTKKLNIDIGKRTQYSLRHSFNTFALNNIDKRDVIELMGISNSIAFYDHRTPRMVLAQLQIMKDVHDNR